MSATTGFNYLGSDLSNVDNNGIRVKIKECVTVLRSGRWMLLDMGDCETFVIWDYRKFDLQQLSFDTGSYIYVFLVMSSSVWGVMCVLSAFVCGAYGKNSFYTPTFTYANLIDISCIARSKSVLYHYLV